MSSQADVVVDRTRRFLDFLAALARELTTTPDRDIRSIEDAHLVWPQQVPRLAAVQVGPGEDRPAWLTVHKSQEPVRPDLPPALVQDVDPASLEDFTTGPQLITPPTDEGHKPSADPESGSERSPLQDALDAWTMRLWRPWALAVQPARAARRLYAELFGLHLMLQSKQVTHELVWGHSVLSWRVGDVAVFSPLLTTRMTIEIDEDDGSLRVIPERGCELELDALEGLDLPLIEELSGLRERLRHAPPDPWLPGGLKEINQQVLAPLGLDASLSDTVGVPAPGPHAVLTPTWVVFARHRPVRHERFYQQLAEIIDERQFLPEGIAAVVAEESSIEQAVLELGSDAGQDWTSVGERQLMPLPSNQDQERIVRQLARARGVTVQGPPGTGKTHTIANLVSHLVAHGKRVLVTAQNEQALSVLRDKIPPELRDLSVAVLGSSPEAMDQLRASAQAMTDMVSGLDEEHEARRIAELDARVDQSRIEVRQVELAMIEALRIEESEFDLPTGRVKAAEVAAWLAAHETTLGVLPDRIPADAVLPLTDHEIADLYTLCTTLDPADVAALRMVRPSTADLPVGASFAEQYARWDRLRQKVVDLEQDGVDLVGIDGLTLQQVADLTTSTRAAAERLIRLEQPWLQTIRDAVRHSPSLRGYWVEQIDRLTARSHTVVHLQRQLIGWTVQVPAGDHRVQLDLLDDLATRFRDGKGVPRLGARDLRHLHEAVTVNGLPLRSPHDIEVANAHVRLGVEIQALHIHLGQLAAQTGLPLPTSDGGFITQVEALTHQLQDALAWETSDRTQLVTSLRRAVTVPDVPDSALLSQTADLLAGSVSRRQERELAAAMDAWAHDLDTGRDQPNASPLWGLLRSALAAQRWDHWDTVITESSRLDQLAPSLLRRDLLLDRLRSVAPAWAAQLERGGESARDPRPDLWRPAWQWAQADAWLTALHATGRLEILQRRADTLRAELAETIVDLARRSAAMGLKRNLKDSQRRALSAWLAALRKKGKGTGKYATHWEQQAREQLPEAMGAVPIWIMPIHRVIENFDPRRSELFDVVIVDESSQCDLLSVGVLALGRKTVIVGDDKQTSPSAVGIDRAGVMQLQDLYLADVPQKALLTVDESLYGIAERAFPNVVMLREHFRCVPEIIQFSNRYYDDRILPLREQTRHGIGPVLRGVHVADAACIRNGSDRVNHGEAAALVAQLVACTQDRAYDGATFGVVSLQSGGQSRILEQLLLDDLGLEEFQRRQLRVGTAAAFQGDERDVVFISVVADDHGYAATRNADKQRINVAASRARDQLWVFHTVDPATLNAEDQRKALIDYVRDAATRREETTDLLARCESRFERDVLAALVDRDYRVSVQHKVGSYRIDIVIHGDRDRLAIECDGDRFHGPEQWDNDLRRQRVLERLGWKFWRLLASSYYRDPHEALTALWQRLDQLNIHSRQDTTDTTPPPSPAPRSPSHPPERHHADAPDPTAAPVTQTLLRLAPDL